MRGQRSGTVLHHPYADDQQPDHRGATRCADCGLPRANRSHQLPNRSDEEKALEARKVGDT